MAFSILISVLLVASALIAFLPDVGPKGLRTPRNRRVLMRASALSLAAVLIGWVLGMTLGPGDELPDHQVTSTVVMVTNPHAATKESHG